MEVSCRACTSSSPGFFFGLRIYGRMPYLQYDPAQSRLRFGFFVCRVCGQKFYGGGCAAIHTKECTSPGYDETVYVFGDHETWALLREIPLPTADQIRRARAAPGTELRLG